MAGATLTVLPLIVAYFLAQKQFVEGIVITGMKS
jgi:multiple sugar transport system permease protein